MHYKGVMTIIHTDFLRSLIGARFLDSQSIDPTHEQFLLGRYCFDDKGASYIPTEERGLPNLGTIILRNIQERELLGMLDDWGATVRHLAGYWEPESWVLQ